MKKEIKTIEKDGYNGVYWPNPSGGKCCVIAMLGNDTKNLMAKGGVKWLQKKGVNVLTMSPAKKDYGHHNYPLERFEKAIAFLKAMGNEKIGIVGASTTGMLALVAASWFSEITLPVGSGLFISMCFKEATQHPKECKQTRIDLDERVSEELLQWINSAR